MLFYLREQGTYFDDDNDSRKQVRTCVPCESGKYSGTVICCLAFIPFLLCLQFERGVFRAHRWLLLGYICLPCVQWKTRTADALTMMCSESLSMPSAEADQHRLPKTTCAEQPVCTLAGTQYMGSDPKLFRTCKSCADKTYQVQGKHRVTGCTPQPKCRKGSYLSTDDKTKAGVCTPCGTGEYQDKDDFQGTSCTSCGTTECPAGKNTPAPR